jgi:hypothetical protein
MIPTNSDLSLSEQPPGVSPVPLPHYSPRIQSLDVLRGIAVLGALFVSIWIFGGFSSNQQSGLLIKSKGFDYRLFGTVDLLFEGKMRALIGFVFGAGMLLFLSKDNQRNVSNHVAQPFWNYQRHIITMDKRPAISFRRNGHSSFSLCTVANPWLIDSGYPYYIYLQW